MIKLVLIRHGESLWNKENRFTGWKDMDAYIALRGADNIFELSDVPPDNIGRWYVGGPLQGAGGLAGSKPPAEAPIDDAPIDEGTP